MKVFKTGDLVYSFASNEFMLILKAYGDHFYYVYYMTGKTKAITDVTLTHIESLEKDFKDKFKIF